MTSTAVVRHRVRRLVPRPALAVAAAAGDGVALIPLVYLGVRAGEAGWARISEELFTARTGDLAARSLALTGVVTAACTALGVVSAFLVTRTDLPARRLFGVLVALPLAVPSYVAAFAWVSTVEGFEGFWAAALLRPEQIEVISPTAAATVTATVVRRDFQGHDALLALRLADGTPVVARIFDPASVPHVIGGEVGLRVRGSARAFPASPGAPA